jgi:PD-(D/E)XK nuclease superfamily
MSESFSAQEAIAKICLKIDSQVLSAMNTCAEKYRLQFVERWRQQKKPAPLEKGSLIHQMLDHYYTERMHGRTEDRHQAELIRECEMVGRVYMAESDTIEARDFERIFLPVFREYVLKYQYDGWEILAVEEPFTKVLYDSARLKIEYEGKIDLLVKQPGMGRAVVDTKTESQFRNPFQLNNQFQGYEWAFECPVIINKIGLQPPKDKDDMTDEQQIDQRKARFRRLVHETGPACIAEWREDTIRQVIEAIGWHKDMEAGKRLRKNRTACDMWSGCEYQKVCLEAGDSYARENELSRSFFQDKEWSVGLLEEEEEVIK